MLYREIMAICSQIHTKHINTQCGQNVEFYLNLNYRVYTKEWRGNLVVTPTEHQLWRLHSRTGRCSPLRRQPPSLLATPFAGSNTMRFLSLGVRYRQCLRTTIAHVPQRTEWSDNACTADNYSGHAAPSLGWIWLPRGCVSCDPGCPHWRIVINAWETWTVAAADGVRYARVSWEVNFLLNFETAPFFCVYPVYIKTQSVPRSKHTPSRL